MKKNFCHFRAYAVKIWPKINYMCCQIAKNLSPFVEIYIAEIDGDNRFRTTGRNNDVSVHTNNNGQMWL